MCISIFRFIGLTLAVLASVAIGMLMCRARIVTDSSCDCDCHAQALYEEETNLLIYATEGSSYVITKKVCLMTVSTY